MSIDLDAALETAIAAAIAGGQAVKRYFPAPKKPKKIHRNRPPQIRADKKANLSVLRVISQRVRDHGIPFMVSEEGLAGQSKSSLTLGTAKEYCWYVDPMDNSSTTSETGYAVSVGGVDPLGKPIFAAIYTPVKDGYELFFARDGEGAFVQFGRNKPSRIRVSHHRDLSDIRVAKGGRDDALGVEIYDNAGILKDTQHRLTLHGGVRKGVEIARGNLEGWFAGQGYDSHDICAITCLVREAGGQVVYTSGADVMFPNPYEARHEGVFWSNGLLGNLEEAIRDHKGIKELRGRFHDPDM